jgi:alpha-mannosidase
MPIARPEPAPTEAPTATSSERLLYLVCTVHLDTQWRWTIRDTIRDFLPATLAGNFALFESYPSYLLSFEGAFRYMLIQEYYPEQWKKLASWVEAGRWKVAGRMLESPDVNVPSPESLIRQMLYGHRFFARELGASGEDVFLPDCFGFPYSLPSIAAHCGVKGFSSSKLIKWLPPARPPFEIGRWIGPDGSSLVAVLKPGGYGEGLDKDLSASESWLGRIERLGEKTGVYAGLRYLGIGDRGGAPPRSAVRQLEKSVAGKGPVTVRPAASDQLFRDLAPEQVARLPEHRGELLLPRHGAGCYTSQAVMKRWNRRNELLADAAERAAVLADWLGAMPYPGKTLRETWIRFLWHQMHDDLTGTSIPQAYRFSWNDEAIALNRFSTILADAVGAASRVLDTRGEGEPLVVFNPLSTARRDLVEARVRFGDPAPTAVTVYDAEGRPLPTQVLERERDGLRVLFVAELPPVGLAVFDVRPGRLESAAESGLVVADDRLENDRYRVRIDRRGDLESVYDKLHGFELLAGPARWQLLRDRSPRWPAWEIRYEDVQARPRECLGRPARAKVIERGPVRATIEITRHARGSTFVQRVSLAAGGAGERLEIEGRVRWRTRGRLLKASFPLTTANPRATYDLGLGTIERGNNRPEKYEVPAQQWADLTTPDGERGVSILSDSKYGWDKPDDATLRLSLLRSPRTFRKFPHQATQDFGRHRFRYALYGHAAGWAEGGTSWQAARLNQPPEAFQARRHDGKRRSISLLDSSSDSVTVRAVKRGEDVDELVVRLQETAGRTADGVEIGFAAPITEGREIDGVEEPLGSARIDGGRLVADLEAYQPRAFALKLEPPATPLPSPRCLPLDLSFDLAAASFHGQRRGPDFDGRGRSLPGELLPATIDSAGVELRLGPLAPGAANCLACRGQKLELPAADGGRLVLLAASVGDKPERRLRVTGSPTEIEVAHWSRSIGGAPRPSIGGLRRSRSQPTVLRRDPIAWLGTHLHDSRVRDRPYAFCYLFRYLLEIEPGTTRLRLPKDSRIRIFAATLVTGDLEIVDRAGSDQD